MNAKRQQELARIELLDADFRENGISQAYKQKWGVPTNVGTWIIGKQTVAMLQDLIAEHQPQNIVEVGTSVGYSAIVLADAAESYGGQVQSIELAEYKYKEALERTEGLGLDLKLIHADAGEVLQSWNQSIDLLFLDGNKRGYLKQLKSAEPYLSEHAIVVADNVTDMKKQVQDFLDYIQASDLYETEILDIDHGVLVAKKSQ